VSVSFDFMHRVSVLRVYTGSEPLFYTIYNTRDLKKTLRMHVFKNYTF